MWRTAAAAAESITRQLYFLTCASFFTVWEGPNPQGSGELWEGVVWVGWDRVMALGEPQVSDVIVDWNENMCTGKVKIVTCVCVCVFKDVRPKQYQWQYWLSKNGIEWAGPGGVSLSLTRSLFLSVYVCLMEQCLSGCKAQSVPPSWHSTSTFLRPASLHSLCCCCKHPPPPAPHPVAHWVPAWMQWCER